MHLTFNDSDAEDSDEGDEPPPQGPFSHGDDDNDDDMVYHPILDGTPCDAHGQDLPPDTPPPPKDNRPDDWTPFGDRLGYELTDFCFTEVQLGKHRIDQLFQILAALCLMVSGGDREKGPPFATNRAMEDAIDAIRVGDAPWQCFVVRYEGERPAENVPKWMDEEFEVWTRNPLTIARQHISNPDFNGEWDSAPYREFTNPQDREEPRKRTFKDFMSANWAWKQCDDIAADPQTHGGMFVPIISGSDKTTVSVATGQNDYYPLYQSVGNVHNNVRRAHRNSVTLTAFLSVPKVNRQGGNSPLFRKFRRQLFHSSLAAIFEPLKHHMTVPDIVMCPDGHYRRAIYGFGPYIADYPEQVLLSCVVQNWCPRCTAPPDNLDGGPALRRSREHREKAVDLWSLAELWDGYGIVGDIVPFTDSFPRADINELLSMDLLHQLIKGGFKDHLVTWVGEYLVITHGAAKAREIMDDIDRRISLAPTFTGLRRFHQGRNFKQWTGDDSKALMKVYVNAIEGHVPRDMVRAISAYLDFCYLARWSELSETDLNELDKALERFYEYRTVFQTYGVRPPGPEGLSIPQQHAMKHYRELIEWFGAPNGLCTSITEAKHIKVVKEPWRRSNRFEALGQMLLINQRLDKMVAAKVDLKQRGMRHGSLLGWVFRWLEDMVAALDEEGEEGEGEEGGQEGIGEGADPASGGPPAVGKVDEVPRGIDERKYPKRIDDLGHSIGVPNLRALVYSFLCHQLTDEPVPDAATVLRVFHSAMALFRAASDPSGLGDMRREYIRSTPSWRKDGARRDCILVSVDSNNEGIEGIEVARTMLFFSFKFAGTTFPCALVQWFSRVDSVPDADTGMWVLRPDTLPSGGPVVQVIHLDTIRRAAHILPIFNSDPVHPDMHFSDTLNWYRLFYLNKWADHDSFDMLYCTY
ncbi:hypothetical protein OF83DRAFT_1164796 [Amylostereum chailletii]|nr:hypothetical protein OF83DRAFT_1164796 [Amylostereum chailletii]